LLYVSQAEVQNVGSDGSVSLHTRSLKYGKVSRPQRTAPERSLHPNMLIIIRNAPQLENGQLLQVPSGLIKRMAQHYVSFPFGVDIILGANGYIWITRAFPVLALFQQYNRCMTYRQTYREYAEGVDGRHKRRGRGSTAR
jgi:exosome complex RNA-binding protein Rrp4